MSHIDRLMSTGLEFDLSSLEPLAEVCDSIVVALPLSSEIASLWRALPRRGGLLRLPRMGGLFDCLAWEGFPL